MSYTTPKFGYYYPTTITLPAMCAYSNTRGYVIIGRPPGVPKESCTNPVSPTIKPYVSAPKVNLNARNARITMTCDVFFAGGPNAPQWIFQVKFRFRLIHQFDPSVGFHLPKRSAFFEGQFCPQGLNRCWPTEYIPVPQR